MNHRLVIALLALPWIFGPAASQTLELVEGAHELSLRNMTLPRSIADSVIFRPCDDCEPTALPIDATTQFITATGRMPLADFLERAADLAITIEPGQTIPVTVYYALATGRATRITIHDDDS